MLNDKTTRTWLAIVSTVIAGIACEVFPAVLGASGSVVGVVSTVGYGLLGTGAGALLLQSLTGPVIQQQEAVIAHQSNRIEKLAAQTEQLAEQNVALLGQMINTEHMLDEHVYHGLMAHVRELTDIAELVRQVHSVVCVPSDNPRVAGGADSLADVPISAVEKRDR